MILFAFDYQGQCPKVYINISNRPMVTMPNCEQSQQMKWRCGEALGLLFELNWRLLKVIEIDYGGGIGWAKVMLAR